MEVFIEGGEATKGRVQLNTKRLSAAVPISGAYGAGAPATFPADRWQRQVASVRAVRRVRLVNTLRLTIFSNYRQLLPSAPLPHLTFERYHSIIVIDSNPIPWYGVTWFRRISANHAAHRRVSFPLLRTEPLCIALLSHVVIPPALGAAEGSAARNLLFTRQYFFESEISILRTLNPSESALTENVSLTPLESALPKHRA
jgi:hypothetical protein